MKQRLQPLPKPDVEESLDALSRALAALARPDDVRAFLEDLCTPAELESMSDRWKVVPLLLEGVPYREIHDRTLVSVTTIGRVARTLERGSGGYDAALRRLRRSGAGQQGRA
jgi:TrpR-related protein YerC/YecD